MSDNIPEGFGRLKVSIGFIELVGPLYGKWDGTHLLMGFRADMRHCNPGRIVHGGMLATFADMFIPIAARIQGKADVGFAPTINLNLDFIAPAKLGAWVEGKAEFLRAGKTLFFAQGTATADGALCMRANGTFRVTGASGWPLEPSSVFDIP